MSTCSIQSHAIGYNKIVDNELGGKTTYVGTEYLEEYIKKLKDEKCMKLEIHAQIDTSFILGRVIYWNGFQLL